jgi:hypothetical protein
VQVSFLGQSGGGLSGLQGCIQRGNISGTSIVSTLGLFLGDLHLACACHGTGIAFLGRFLRVRLFVAMVSLGDALIISWV